MYACNTMDQIKPLAVGLPPAALGPQVPGRTDGVLFRHRKDGTVRAPGTRTCAMGHGYGEFSRSKW